MGSEQKDAEPVSLTWPMHVVPGQLLRTSLSADIRNDLKFFVPPIYDGSMLSLGDLMTVIASRKNTNNHELIVGCKAWALHHRSQRILYFNDVMSVKWLWNVEDAR